MLKYLMSRKLYERGLFGLIICIIAFIIGQLILNRISTMENPPMGNTIYILIGSTFVFTSIIGALLILKYIFDEKRKKERRERKRKNHKIYFLKNRDKDSLQSDS